jgi:hypothetical protein
MSLRAQLRERQAREPTPRDAEYSDASGEFANATEPRKPRTAVAPATVLPASSPNMASTVPMLDPVPALIAAFTAVEPARLMNGRTP